MKTPVKYTEDEEIFVKSLLYSGYGLYWEEENTIVLTEDFENKKKELNHDEFEKFLRELYEDYLTNLALENTIKMGLLKRVDEHGNDLPYKESEEYHRSGLTLKEIDDIFIKLVKRLKNRRGRKNKNE